MSDEQNNAPVSHFVMLHPKEKLYIITDRVAGETDYTQVVEIVFPTLTEDGKVYFDPKKGCHQEARAAYEINMMFNLISGGDGGQTMFPDAAIALLFVDGNAKKACVSVPLDAQLKMDRVKLETEAIEELTKMGVEFLND